MDKIIKNILTRIENEGYEAYIVGGFVRDTLLKRSTYDIDICTNALPKDLVNIFPKNDATNNYGGFKLKIKEYNIDITTYRKEIKYDKRKPVEIEYISNLIEDIKRRDFTINSLCMDKNNKIIDILEGKKDIELKLIRSLGEPNTKFKEDPLRMLRAIRFATILDFKIDSATYQAICNNYSLISSLSNDRIKEEISKILSSKNFMVGIKLLEDTNISKIIGLEYSDLVYCSDIIGMWSQIKINRVDFNNNEKQGIKAIREIIAQRRINNYTLYKHGLYLSTVASEILNIDKKEINKLYKNLPIKTIQDIDINGSEIIRCLNIEPGKIVSDIINDVKKQILNKDLKNKKSEILKYIIGKWSHEQR